MISRRRLFFLPGVMLAALPQMPWERPAPATLTLEELTAAHYRHNAAINTHTWMHKIHNGRFAVLEKQILRPGRRVRGGKV